MGAGTPETRGVDVAGGPGCQFQSGAAGRHPDADRTGNGFVCSARALVRADRRRRRPKAGVAEGIATVLSIFFSLNILLGFFNLIPFPPLDGYGVLGLFTTDAGALRLQQLRMKMGAFSFLGLVIAWQLFDRVFPTFSPSADTLFTPAIVSPESR